MYKTIGIGGQLCSGKDCVSDYLVGKLNDLYNIPWKRNAFANKVKETFETAFGKNREWVEEWKRVEECPEGFIKNVRQCLISIGDGFRQMKPDIWIELAFRNQNSHQIISDVRYINECNYIRNLGGITVLLWRKGYENDLPNASEQQFMPFVRKLLDTDFEGRLTDPEIPFDFFLRNDGDLYSLYKKIDELLIPFILSVYH